MNRNEYEPKYSGSYRPVRTPCQRGAASVAPSSRNDYDVESMLSARSLPQRDYSRWEQRPDTNNYDRRSEYKPPASQYMRIDSPPRHYSSYRDPDYDRLELPPRREYSPVRKMGNELEDSFKGFTTPLPGNDHGYVQEQIDETRLRRYTEPERGSFPEYSSTLPGNDAYASKKPRYRYRTENRDQRVYEGDYLPEPMRHVHSTKPKYEHPLPEHYTRDAYSTMPVPKNHNPEYYRSWDSTPCWDNETVHPGQYLGEQTLSPRTFKRECQRAYKEARAQRIRNLEEGLYGKCDWATFDSKYC